MKNSILLTIVALTVFASSCSKNDKKSHPKKDNKALIIGTWDVDHYEMSLSFDTTNLDTTIHYLAGSKMTFNKNRSYYAKMITASGSERDTGSYKIDDHNLYLTSKTDIDDISVDTVKIKQLTEHHFKGEITESIDTLGDIYFKSPVIIKANIQLSK